MSISSHTLVHREEQILAERTRLVRLCGRLTGDTQVAEDLAQETLIEAWSHIHQLRDPDSLSAWLSGIARNVCLRWARTRGRERTHFVEQGLEADPTLDLADVVTDEYDLEVELERKELVELLDRALTLLPPETRAVLVERYVKESSLNEIAARLHLNLGTVAMRIQRGKLAFQKVLTTDLQQEFEPYLLPTTTIKPAQTRIWCLICGQRQLTGYVNHNVGMLHLKCPLCAPGELSWYVNMPTRLIGDVKGYGRAFARTLDWIDQFQQHYHVGQMVPCYACGESTLLRESLQESLHVPQWWQRPVFGWYYHCDTCSDTFNIEIEGIVMALPEIRQFTKEQNRIRQLPTREIEVDGRAALLMTVESVTSQAHIDVMLARDTHETLKICR
jgi:RNA polymerase sigma factor (sigma-70 family)